MLFRIIQNFFICIFLLWSVMAMGQTEKDQNIKFSNHSDSIKKFKYKEKIEFIHDLSSIIKKDLLLNTGENFFNSWQPEDKPLNYVYYSSADSVYCPKIGPYPFSSFGTKEEAANTCLHEHAQAGRHTLLYQTAGASSAQLNSQLLNYDFESIAFIVFHEAMHKHLENSHTDLPYEFVEASCDVLGNYGPVFASASLKKLKIRKIKEQINTNEQVFSVINYYYSLLLNIDDRAMRDSVFIACENEIFALIGKGNKFRKDRFRYKINNAYFLRWNDYTNQYFFLKDLYQTKSLSGFLNSILWLSINKNSGKNQLVEKHLENPSPPLPFDVIAKEKDDNGFPKNPVWGYQYLYGNDSLPGKVKMHLSNDFKEWYAGKSPCTHDQLFRDPNTFPGCGLAHINWFPLTYECTVFWKDHAFDDDYNFKLKREDKALYTEDNPTWVYAEFDSDETVDLWKKKPQSSTQSDFWDYLHHQVDSCDPTAGRSLNGKEAIVTGLLGLDCSHAGETELHPVYLMAIHLKEDPVDDTWAFFVRNWGNQGWCGNSQHYLQTRMLKLRLPKKGVKNFSYNEKTQIKASTIDPFVSTTLIQDSGAVITFYLPPPEQHGWIKGELHINWKENQSQPVSTNSIVEKLNDALIVQNESPPIPYPPAKTTMGKGKRMLFFKRVW